MRMPHENEANLHEQNEVKDIKCIRFFTITAFIGTESDSVQARLISVETFVAFCWEWDN